MNNQDWTSRFVSLLERSLVFCGNAALKEECLAALGVYRSGIDPLQDQPPLKALIKEAAEQASAQGKDPYEAILVALAGRTQDCYNYFTDDQEIYQDIKDWLEAEAAMEFE